MDFMDVLVIVYVIVFCLSFVFYFLLVNRLEYLLKKNREYDKDDFFRGFYGKGFLKYQYILINQFPGDNTQTRILWTYRILLIIVVIPFLLLLLDIIVGSIKS